MTFIQNGDLADPSPFRIADSNRAGRLENIDVSAFFDNSVLKKLRADQTEQLGPYLPDLTIRCDRSEDHEPKENSDDSGPKSQDAVEVTNISTTSAFCSSSMEDFAGNPDNDTADGDKDSDGMADGDEEPKGTSDKATKQDPVERLSKMSREDVMKLSDAERIELLRGLTADDIQRLKADKGLASYRLRDVVAGIPNPDKIALCNEFSVQTLEALPSDVRSALLVPETLHDLPMEKRLAFARAGLRFEDKLRIVNDLTIEELKKIPPESRAGLFIGIPRDLSNAVMDIPVEKRMAALDGIPFSAYRALMDGNGRRIIPIEIHVQQLNKATPEEIRQIDYEARWHLVHNILHHEKDVPRLSGDARVALFNSLKSTQLQGLSPDTFRAYLRGLNPDQSFEILRCTKDLAALELIPMEQRIDLLKNLTADHIQALSRSSARFGLLFQGFDFRQAREILASWGTPEKSQMVPRTTLTELLRRIGADAQYLPEEVKKVWAERLTPQMIRNAPEACNAIRNSDNPPGDNPKGPGNGGGDKPTGGPGTGNGDKPKGPGGTGGETPPGDQNTKGGDKSTGPGSTDKPDAGTDTSPAKAQRIEIARRLLQGITPEQLANMDPTDLRLVLQAKALQEGTGLTGEQLKKMKEFQAFLDNATELALKELQAEVKVEAASNIAAAKPLPTDGKIVAEPTVVADKPNPILPAKGAPTAFDGTNTGGIGLKPTDKVVVKPVEKPATGKIDPIITAKGEPTARKTFSRVVAIAAILSTLKDFVDK